MLTVAVLAVVAMILAIQLKGMKSEYGIYISLGACLLIVMYGVERLSLILTAINQIQSYLAIPSSYISMFVKMLGITYLCEFSAALCKDGGYQSIASQLEIFGKLCILALCTPVILALFETIERLLAV